MKRTLVLITILLFVSISLFAQDFPCQAIVEEIHATIEDAQEAKAAVIEAATGQMPEKSRFHCLISKI